MPGGKESQQSLSAAPEVVPAAEPRVILALLARLPVVGLGFLVDVGLAVRLPDEEADDEADIDEEAEADDGEAGDESEDDPRLGSRDNFWGS